MTTIILASQDYVASAIAAVTADFQPAAASLTTLAGLTATTDNFIVSAGGAWASRTPAQVKTTLALNNVDNTSDANKPISTAEQAALNLKLNASAVSAFGLTLIDDADPAAARGTLGLGNVNNTSDAAKPVSTAQQTALDLKANLTAVPNSSYRVIFQAAGTITAAQTAGIFGLPASGVAIKTGVGSVLPLMLFYIAGADFPTVNGVTTKLRCCGTLSCNDIAPTGNFTLALHPVTRPATSGGAGLNIWTIGAAVAGSGIALNTPAADSLQRFNGADFTIPADGMYCLAVTTTGTIAASSHVAATGFLMMRNA